MDKEKLLPLVIEEAKKLKNNATNTERSNLNFDTLSVSHQERCIYGQMTGNCFSPRASELLQKCAPSKVFHQPKGSMCEFYEDEMVMIKKPKTPRTYEYSEYFSPIECFITFPENEKNGNNKMLIDFLQGKIKTLKFKPF